jgi:MoxR-like ATPase
MLRQLPASRHPELREVLGRRDLLDGRALVDRVPVADHLLRYAAALVRATRPSEPPVPGFVNDFVEWGAGPRASADLVTAAKARAILCGRFHVAVDDVQSVAPAVLRHRLGLTFTAHSEGVRPAQVIDRLLAEIPTGEALYSGDARDPNSP